MVSLKAKGHPIAINKQALITTVKKKTKAFDKYFNEKIFLSGSGNKIVWNIL